MNLEVVEKPLLATEYLYKGVAVPLCFVQITQNCRVPVWEAGRTQRTVGDGYGKLTELTEPSFVEEIPEIFRSQILAGRGLEICGSREVDQGWAYGLGTWSEG